MLGYLRHVSGALMEISSQPLNSSNRLRSIANFYRWRIGTKLIGSEREVVVPWVDDSRFAITRDEHGLAGNIYTGLMDFGDMGFLLHVMRPSGLFVDVGANLGAYTILASAVVGAKTIAFEPIPSTVARLIDQVRLNGIERLVTIKNEGVGSAPGVLSFALGASNCVTHVALGGESRIEKANVTTLDKALAGEVGPIFLKVDVEGFEYQVIQGGRNILNSAAVQGMIVELNGSGEAFGHPNQQVHDEILALGFRPVHYAPLERRLTPAESFNTSGGNNTIYVKDLDAAQKLCSSASVRTVHTAAGRKL